jgi:hypothetical protein
VMEITRKGGFPATIPAISILYKYLRTNLLRLSIPV